MPRRRLTAAHVPITSYGRREFFDEVFDYHPGDHCTFLAPYGGGKTQIAFQALEVTASPDLQATIFVMKPKDVTVTKFMTTHPKKWPLIRSWPPSRVTLKNRVLREKVDGYVLWPKEAETIEADEAWQSHVFGIALGEMYKAARKKANIMFVDEVFSMENELDLKGPLRRAWTKGRSVGNGLWSASQRPAMISQYAYQAQHMFIGFDADERAQKRYAEIGVGDPAQIKAIINGLARFEFLYISREERAMCIIEAS